MASRLLKLYMDKIPHFVVAGSIIGGGIGFTQSITDTVRSLPDVAIHIAYVFSCTSLGAVGGGCCGAVYPLSIPIGIYKMLNIR